MRNSVKTCLLIIVLGVLTFFNGCSSDDGEPKITAAEGLFINEIYAAGDDWVELYNSTDAAKDISGYSIQDAAETTYELPAGTIVPANGYLVIFCDDTNTGLHTNFQLSSSGETVTLKNTNNQIAETVTSPQLDNGQSYGRYPDGSENFALSGLTSQGASNDASNAPAITSVSRTPLVPGIGQAVNIQAELTNTAELSTVKLFYRFNGGTYTEVNMALGGAFYNATIPAQATTGRVDYYIEAKSSTMLTTYKPFDAPGDAYYYLLNTDILPLLYVNEIMAASTTCCPDIDGGTAEFDDWIEIYNDGTNPVHLGGMYLSDDLTDPFKSKIPTGVTILAKGYVIFWADEDGSQGSKHLNFKLSKGGEAVGLFYIDGRKINDKEFGEQEDNKSLERSADGTWKKTTSPTPGTTNNP